MLTYHTTMKKIFSAVLVPFLLSACDRRAVEVDPQATSTAGPSPDVYAHTVDNLQGNPVDLEEFRGKVTMMVNVASKCGFTPQYAKLQQLQEAWEDRGFSVIAFPCNDYGKQEPGGPDQIAQTCRVQYGATFPVMAKVRVKDGPDQSIIYQQLQAATGVLPRWNFGKYVVDPNGHPVAFFGSGVDPTSGEVQRTIEKHLN